ncbi:MAG: tRNA 4-thiouridine(8) synthase ThiI [Ruminococcus sp.]|nr:tRNA 4-thiouridine(8) synthase ThiI [Ruminococcus sp.]
MKEIVLIKVGEIVLKGLNRKNFESMLIKNIKHALNGTSRCKVNSAQSTIYVEPLYDDADIEEICERLQKVFGIVAFHRAAVAEKTMQDITSVALSYLEDYLDTASTFKVEAKRSDKKFPLNSPQICRQLGHDILQKFDHLSVDVHNPDVQVTVEVRDFGAYIHAGVIKGAGGVPVGSSGNGTILISGGIDSPVAAWMMAKRGLRLNAVHFASPPYTSQRAEDKVVRLLQKVAGYAGNITMYVVPFTEIQETIRNKCPEELFTIIMRRLMMQISQHIAQDTGSSCLITGESLGQVASQTMQAIVTTDEAADMVVFRPLIGMDKEEIVKISRKIDTFDISIEPYEDCCTVFTPKHPRTKPVLKYVKQAQEDAGFDSMVETALNNLKVINISSSK